VIIGKNEYNKILYGIEAVLVKVTDKTDLTSHCHDCSLMFNGYHHFLCEMETSPRCGYQFISHVVVESFKENKE
jgi:hypothetical protein